MLLMSLILILANATRSLELALVVAMLVIFLAVSGVIKGRRLAKNAL